MIRELRTLLDDGRSQQAPRSGTITACQSCRGQVSDPAEIEEELRGPCGRLPPQILATTGNAFVAPTSRSCRAHNGRGSEEGNNSKGTKNPDENDKVEQAHAVLQAAPPELVRGFAIHLVPMDEVPGRTPATALGGFGG